MIRVLFVGETWMFEKTEFKGFDKFTVSGYEVATQWIEAALNKNGFEFNHIAAHEVDLKFPKTLEELKKFDVVMISDVGANTFLLGYDTFFKGEIAVNKLELIKEYVSQGGGFAMVGGYLSYQGFEAKGKYFGSQIAEILPVEMMINDDRVEMPQGYNITIDPTSHEIFDGVEANWPPILGYNKLKAKQDAIVIAKKDEDALITLGSFGKGRTVAYATDCSPHWATNEFCDWKCYEVLWQNISRWLANK